MAFLRYDPMTNGGASGSAGVEVSPILDAALEAVATAPTDGWITDDEKTYAMGDWYDYDHATHVLSAKQTVYVLRNASGDAWKVQFVDYYDDAGNSGHPSFRWAPL
jgi:hypothetical protein